VLTIAGNEELSMSASDRYTNDPFLKFMELYVLWTIGEITDAEEQSMTRMAPYLYKSLANTGAGEGLTAESPWHELISKTLGLSEELPDEIRKYWQANRAVADQNRMILTPLVFAQMFVDEQFKLGQSGTPQAGGSGQAGGGVLH
jgi:hypothetical protein